MRVTMTVTPEEEEHIAVFAEINGLTKRDGVIHIFRYGLKHLMSADELRALPYYKQVQDRKKIRGLAKGPQR